MGEVYQASRVPVSLPCAECSTQGPNTKSITAPPTIYNPSIFLCGIRHPQAPGPGCICFLRTPYSHTVKAQGDVEASDQVVQGLHKYVIDRSILFPLYHLVLFSREEEKINLGEMMFTFLQDKIKVTMETDSFSKVQQAGSSPIVTSE